MKHTLFTIGHSTHPATRFIKILKLYSVKEVWDVRSQPYSKYNKLFNKDCIEKELNRNNIDYLFMGYELGGRINNPTCYDDNGKLQYQRVAQLPTFQSALDRLKDKLNQTGLEKGGTYEAFPSYSQDVEHEFSNKSSINTCNIALMCSEDDPLQCHRMVLICRNLSQKNGFVEKKIKHILPDGSVSTNTEMEKLLMDKFKLYPDMFRTEQECIEGAYNQQAQKIAYTYKESRASSEGIYLDQSDHVFNERSYTHTT